MGDLAGFLRRAQLPLLVMVLAAQAAEARFVVEKNSLMVTSPTKLRGRHDSAIGNFGIPQYGGSMAGAVVYPMDNADACDAFDGKHTFRAKTGALPTFLLVDRGNCLFAKKVWSSQNAGASAVLVVDDKDEPLITMDLPREDDEAAKYIQNITIPSALIDKKFGEQLKKAVKDGDMVNVNLDWREAVPHPDDRVEYELWTNSNDECGPKCDMLMNFLKEFKGAAQLLEKGGYSQFTPHYITWYCPQAFVISKQCKSQCINHGRYCAPDPEQDFSTGYEGKDVVVENLRQLCVFKVANENKKPWVWWDYVTDFHIRCPMKEKKYNKKCAETVIKSLGSASSQRFLSLLIPRFSSYCPTALEAAAKVSISMYKLNIVIVTRREDVKNFAYQTSRDCIIGLTDICSAASSEAPKSSVLAGICSAVYMTVLAFFISTFDRKDMYHVGSRKLPMLQDPVKMLETLKESKDANLPALDYLFELRALCLLCTFILFPENVLEASFVLLASGETDDVKGGLYFLNQLTIRLNIDVANDSLGDKVNGQCLGMDRNMSDTQNVVDSEPSSDGNVLVRNSMVESNECYMTMVISRNPSLRRWILLRYKKLCESCEPAVVSEVSSCLKVLGSLSLAEDKSHMETESSVLEKLDKSIRENMKSDELFSSSEQGVLLKNNSISTHVEKSLQSNNVVVHADGKICEKQTDANINGSEGANVISDAVHKGTRPDLLTPKSTYDSAVGSTTLTSPGWHFGKAKHLYSDLFDIYGVSSSRDVISISKELWVGSLGNRAAEALVRSKFEEFGPLGNLSFYPSKNFALVEYRNIIHAVHACGNMQGSSIWGGFLQIRYLDRLIGSKGFIGGVAIGDSRHIYVAKVKNQKDKDEVFDQLKAAGVKRPCGFTDISSENVLLLEFETAVDAATAKVYIRCHAHADLRSKDKRPGHQVLVQNVDNSVPDVEFINAFTQYGEVIRWQFNRPNGNCLIIYRSHAAAAYAKSQLHGARFGMKSITVESKTCTVGSFHGQTSSVAPILGQSAPDNSICHDIRHPIVSGYHSGYGVPGDRPVYRPSPPNSKQVWQHKEMESNRAPQGIPPCPLVFTHRGSVMPPPPIQTSFVHPAYPGPGSPWENTTPNPPFSHVSPRMMPGSNFRVNPSGPFPFIPSPVAPLAQLPGSSSQHSETMPPPPHLTNSAPPPFTPHPPPPLPISQPPSMPPPPSSPPLQCTADSSDSKKSSSHPQWQGSLSKSGLHYCKIYASRVELDACRYQSAVSEPTEWPLKLDVTKRTDFQHVKATFSNSPPSKREVCQLLPCSNEDQKGLRDFISYLKQRECSGVIKIPPVKPMWSRLLFILPPTAEMCSMLALPPHPVDCLIALILPKETNVEAA